MFAQPYQFRFIYRGENPSRTYRVRPSASVLPQTFRRVAAKDLLKFSRKSHDKGCNEARDTQGTAVAARAKTMARQATAVTPSSLSGSDRSSRGAS